MISYEVTTTLNDASAAERFSDWMCEQHIPQVVAAGGFVGAELARLTETKFRTRYLARDQAALDAYLGKHAERLREEFALHFGSVATNTRDVWTVVDTWGR